jgi:hypothetical protein
VHWIGENMYVLAALGTMLLAARHHWTHRDVPTTPASVWRPRRKVEALVTSG